MQINVMVGLVILVSSFSLTHYNDKYLTSISCMPIAESKKDVAGKEQVRPQIPFLEVFSGKEFTLFIVFKKPDFKPSWPLTPGF